MEALRPRSRFAARGVFPLLAAWALALSVAPPATAAPSLPPAHLARLAHFDVLRFHFPSEYGVDVSKAIALFDATPDEVFRTVTDYERMPEYLPRLVGAKVLDRSGRGDGSGDGEHVLVALRSDLPWPVRDAWVDAEFDAESLPGEVYRVRFWQVRGSMRHYSGYLLIEPWPGPWPGSASSASSATSKVRSTVTYELLAEPDTFLPRGYLNSKLREVAPMFVNALRARVDELHRTDRLHPRQPPLPLGDEDPALLVGERAPKTVEHVAERR